MKQNNKMFFLAGEVGHVSPVSSPLVLGVLKLILQLVGLHNANLMHEVRHRKLQNEQLTRLTMIVTKSDFKNLTFTKQSTR